MRPHSLTIKFEEISKPFKRLLVVLAILTYVVLFLLFYDTFGIIVLSLASLPVLTVAYMYGKWIGLGSSIIFIAVNVLMLVIVSHEDASGILEHVITIGSGLLIFLGFIFGSMGDITRELREKADQYETENR